MGKTKIKYLTHTYLYMYKINKRQMVFFLRPGSLFQGLTAVYVSTLAKCLGNREKRPWLDGDKVINCNFDRLASATRLPTLA